MAVSVVLAVLVAVVLVVLAAVVVAAASPALRALADREPLPLILLATQALMGPDTGLEAEAAVVVLLAVLLLGVTLLWLGIGGIRAFDASGFDDPAGFTAIHRAGRELSKGSSGSLKDEQALAPLFDEILRDAWRQARFAGQMPADFNKADTAARDTVLADLLEEQPNEEQSNLARALRLAREEMTADGVPAYESLILSLDPSLSSRLAQVKAEREAAVLENARLDGRELLKDAVAERRLSRYTNAGANLIPLTQAFKDWHHAPWDSEAFKTGRNRITSLLAEATDNA